MPGPKAHAKRLALRPRLPMARRRKGPVCHTRRRPTEPGGSVASTGLSANPKEYRKRLKDQSDDQIDAWVSELLRDVVIRRGIPKVVEDFRRAAQLDERSFERVFASGGGPPAVIGRDGKGRLVV